MLVENGKREVKGLSYNRLVSHATQNTQGFNTLSKFSDSMARQIPAKEMDRFTQRDALPGNFFDRNMWAVFFKVFQNTEKLNTGEKLLTRSKVERLGRVSHLVQIRRTVYRRYRI